MSKITLDNLSDNLKEHLDTLGLTQEQVQAMIQDAFTSENLQTQSKDIVGAINELFQNVDSGKKLIADAIDNETITKDSTFEAMSNAIEEIRLDKDEIENSINADKNKWYELLKTSGCNVNDTDSMDDLYNALSASSLAIQDIKQVACGYKVTYIIKNDGSLWSCGINSHGQLGLGSSDENTHTTFTQVTKNINNDVEQIACGSRHALMVKTDGSLWTCGYNDYGQLGLGNTSHKSSFTKVTTNINNDVKYVSCGLYNSLIIKNDGSLWAAGLNDYGQLGLGTSVVSQKTFAQVTTNVKQVACYYQHTCIVKNDGSLWSAGLNEYGQLGLNDTTNRKAFTQVTKNINNDVNYVTCGYTDTMIIKTDGSLWGCGRNHVSQLGFGASGTKKTFVQVTTNINNDVKDVKCGETHTLIIKNDNTVWGCGYNYHGQLGLGSTEGVDVFTQVITNIDNDKIKSISCGDTHSFIIKNNNSLWATGDNGYGQLGLGDTTTRNVFSNRKGFSI